MGVSKNRGIPKWMVYMENPIKMDNFGVPLFLETTIYIFLGDQLVGKYTVRHMDPMGDLHNFRKLYPHNLPSLQSLYDNNDSFL